MAKIGVKNFIDLSEFQIYYGTFPEKKIYMYTIRYVKRDKR